ncbi:MAG: hypothetical protein SPL40_08965 [Erysipelotrichaceae bacterium]|nr:hypothetical protein [Erysipelotrichaceae bacterium]
MWFHERLVLLIDSRPQDEVPAYDAMCHEGAYRLAYDTLCGSRLYVNTGVYNLHYQADLPLVTAVNTEIINPVRYLGVDDHKGKIEKVKMRILL